jgi:hypothetical protein
MLKFFLWAVSFISQGKVQGPAAVIVPITTEVVKPSIVHIDTYMNGCTSFQVGNGTGCSWMCDYCASMVGPNYYFTDGVCTYEFGGCVGTPQLGVTYTCCAASL